MRRPAASTAPSAAEIRSLRQPAVVVLAGAAVIYVVLDAVRAGTGASGQQWAFRPWRLLGGSALELITLAWAVLLWWRILACFEGAQPGYRALLRAWRASTLAKYLPGSVWSAASTVEIATRIGASPVALPSSFLLQAVLNLVGALTVAVLFGGAIGSAHSNIRPWLAVTVLGGAVALFHPRFVNAAVRAGARLARRPAPAWNGTWATGASLVLMFVATWLAYGAAFSLFVSGLVPTVGTPWLRLAGMNALAFVAGFVAFFAPGGVGVREAALVGLLGATVKGTATRIALAATSRLWLILTEAVGVALVTVVARPTDQARRPAGPTFAPDAPGLLRAPGPSPSPSRRRVARRPDGHEDGRREERPRTHLGVDVALLTDTRTALADITAACAAARRSIRIAQLAFDADCGVGAPDAATLLETIIGAARRGTPDGTPLDVRIVLNGGLLLDTSPALRRAIVALGAGPTVRVRTVKAFPRVMHAKVLVVDGVEAFLAGASFVNGYWDDARHSAADAPDAGLGTGDRPMHDAAIRLRGSAASDLAAWFDELWRATPSGDTDDGAASPPLAAEAAMDTARATAPWAPGAGAVQVLRTLPAAPERPAGRTEILDAYLEAIDRARSFIYLESQYFSARPIARAVGAALDAHPGLELILVLNQNPDVTAYRGWQDARFAEHGLLDHPRVGVFALWSAVPSLHARGRTEVTQVFVHSKAAVVDDAWATLGTANLDGASLHSYGDDFASRLGRRVFGRFRNYDLNVALPDGVDGTPRTGVAAALRRRLWSRHLGLPAHTLAERPVDGWLSLWRARAAAHVTGLATGAPPTPGGRALPYVPRAQPRAQLRALGIDAHAAGLDLRFDPSWLDAHCNLGWVEKVIPERLRWWRAWR